MVQAVQVATGTGRALGDAGQARQGVAWNLVWVTQRPARKQGRKGGLFRETESSLLASWSLRRTVG